MFGYEEELQEEIVEQKALLKEAYEAIVSYTVNNGYCSNCGAYDLSYPYDEKHDKDCMVNKAEKWLKENR